jgi:ubiquinone/menaquinone biosynthesis C-methylase UbiE
LKIAKIARRVVAIDIDAALLEVARTRLTESAATNCEFHTGGQEFEEGEADGTADALAVLETLTGIADGR